MTADSVTEVLVGMAPDILTVIRIWKLSLLC
jgi:hypothetical protein